MKIFSCRDCQTKSLGDRTICRYCGSLRLKADGEIPDTIAAPASTEVIDVSYGPTNDAIVEEVTETVEETVIETIVDDDIIVPVDPLTAMMMDATADVVLDLTEELIDDFDG